MPFTAEEFQQPRTAAEIAAWVDGAAASFDTKELVIAARRGQHYAKQLFEEARPIANFAQRHYASSPEVIISLVLGNQHYDATVNDRRATPEPIEFLEVTGTRTYEDALRMELLSEEGSAPGTGSIYRDPETRKVVARLEAEDHDVIVGRQLALITAAVKAKAANPNYGERTALIVAVEDWTGLRDKEDKEDLANLAEARLAPLLRECSPFVFVSFEGWRGLHLEYWLR